MTTEAWVRSVIRAAHREAMRINAFFSGVGEGVSFALVSVINSGAPSAASLDAGLTIFEDEFLPNPIGFTHQAVNNFRSGVIRAARQFGNAVRTGDFRTVGFGVGAFGVGLVGTRNSFGGPLPNFPNANLQQQAFMVSRALDRLHREEGISLTQNFLLLRGDPNRGFSASEGILEKFNQLAQGIDPPPGWIAKDRFDNFFVTQGSHKLIARELFNGPLSRSQIELHSIPDPFGFYGRQTISTHIVNIYNRNRTSPPLSTWGTWPSQ